MFRAGCVILKEVKIKNAWAIQVVTTRAGSTYSDQKWPQISEESTLDALNAVN